MVEHLHQSGVTHTHRLPTGGHHGHRGQDKMLGTLKKQTAKQKRVQAFILAMDK